MVRWLGILLRTFRSTVRTRRELALENLALRQQLAVWKARQPRPRLTEIDRVFWIVLSRLWKNWRSSLHVVRPETIVRWHRRGFRLYWGWKSRRRWGRPAIGRDLRDLIRQMSRANPLWGAPRIHGELLKLGLTVSQATVSKYMVRPPRPPSQACRTFLKNHASDLIALDFFTVPSATLRVLFVFVVLTHSRRRLVHFNVTEHPTAEWTARQLLEASALRSCGSMSTTTIGPGHTYRWRRTRPSRGACSHRARAEWRRCHAWVGSITNTCGRRREPIGPVSGRHRYCRSLR